MKFERDTANAGQYGFGIVSWPRYEKREIILLLWRWTFSVIL